jgi:hypothetical protein
MKRLACRKVSARQVDELLASGSAVVDDELSRDLGRALVLDDGQLLLMIGAQTGLLYRSREEFLSRHRQQMAGHAERRRLLDAPFRESDRFVATVGDRLKRLAERLELPAGSLIGNLEDVRKVDRRLWTRTRLRKDVEATHDLIAFVGEAIRAKVDGAWSVCPESREGWGEPCIIGKAGRTYHPAAVLKLLIERKRVRLEAVIEGLTA